MVPGLPCPALAGQGRAGWSGAVRRAGPGPAAPGGRLRAGVCVVCCGGSRVRLAAGGIECGLGAFGAFAVQVGELAAGLQLGVVSGVQGVAFAAGVRAGTLGLGAGVCLGLAGAGDLGLGADPHRCRVIGGLAGLLLAAAGFGAGGGDRRVGAGAGGCCLSLGLPGACLGGLLQVAGGFQGFQGGVQFLVSLGGLGVRDGGGCLSATAAGVGVGQLRADLCRVEPGSFGAGVPGQRGAVAQDSLQPGQRVFAWPGHQAVRLSGRDAVIRAAGAAGAGRVVVSAGARIAAVLPRPAVAGRRDRGAAAGPAAVTHQVTGLAGDQAGGMFRCHCDPFLSFLLTRK